MTTSATADRIRKEEILSSQVELLYSNRNVGALTTLIATAILARMQWSVVEQPVILGWCLYMLAIAAGRLALARAYARSAKPGRGSLTPTHRASPWFAGKSSSFWGLAFSAGAGLAGAGWGAAGVLLYSEADLASQVLLLFILGGMMLGGAILLAPWPAAFLAFLIPAGFVPASRLLLQGVRHGDEFHLAMGAMACLFTVALLTATARIHRAILSSLRLSLENRNLVEDLRAAKSQADALNEHLEVRVHERTAELRRSAEDLRTEIDQRCRIEDELLRARKLESLGVLAGGIAHDFNNFLTVVQGNIEMARLQLRPAEPAQAILTSITSACARAAFLSSQLLTFAKGGVPVRRVVDIAKLVRDAVQLTRAGSPTSIDVSVAGDLRYAEVDSGQIIQALHNILVNARQSMPEGGIVEVHAANAIVPDHATSQARVRISIRDYGCGIPADVLPRIFDPYFTTRDGSSGLGLATAYAIISKHGGSLSVESKVGDGAVFTIDLPALDKTPEPQPPAPAPVPVQTGAGRLLIMDDERALRLLLETVLTNLGYHVQTARDGAEAIALCEDAKAQGRAFDAALLDLTVAGGMGGLEASARLREIDPSMKLVVSSGYSDSAVMSDYRKYGFDEVIPKPWVIADVSGVFRRLFVAGSQRELK